LDSTSCITRRFRDTYKKTPSASTNPASQLGSDIIWSSTLGLSAETISVKASFKESERPKFIAALILKISQKPAGV
jgi:hypothetical protein